MRPTRALFMLDAAKRSGIVFREGNPSILLIPSISSFAARFVHSKRVLGAKTVNLYDESQIHC